MYASRNLDKLLGLGGTYMSHLLTVTPASPELTFRTFPATVAPEPLAELVGATFFNPELGDHQSDFIQYSPSYYRATWIVTGLDAGFATAMAIRPKWLRDVCSIFFSAYYIIYANEADEKVCKYPKICRMN
jgi:hypothetical protein